MKFTLRKSKWLRGEGSNQSRLLRESDGKMCCIGQLAHRCGVPKRDLLNKGDLTELERLRGTLRKFESSDDDGECYSINDNVMTTDAQKIRKLRPILARHGIELEVVE